MYGAFADSAWGAQGPMGAYGITSTQRRERVKRIIPTVPTLLKLAKQRGAKEKQRTTAMKAAYSAISSGKSASYVLRVFGSHLPVITSTAEFKAAAKLLAPKAITMTAPRPPRGRGHSRGAAAAAAAAKILPRRTTPSIARGVQLEAAREAEAAEAELLTSEQATLAALPTTGYAKVLFPAILVLGLAGIAVMFMRKQRRKKK